MPDAAINLMQRADRARGEKRLVDAHSDLIQAVALCRDSDDPDELIRALKKLGQIERDLGRGDAARPLYEEAVALCRAQGEVLKLAHTVRHLGDIYQDAGRLDLAEPCYEEALALYRHDEGTSPLDLANALRPLAILKDANGETEAARRIWQEAMDLYELVNVPQGVAECEARLRGPHQGRIILD